MGDQSECLCVWHGGELCVGACEGSFRHNGAP